MAPDSPYQPEYASLRRLVEDMAGPRALEKRLQTIVDRFSQRPHVALTRVWLIRRGDRCPDCPHRTRCADNRRCLHLVAGAAGEALVSLAGAAGRTVTAAADDPGQDVFNARLPVSGGPGPISEAADQGRMIGYNGLQESAVWLGENPWARGLDFVALGAAPLIHAERVLGVLAVFPVIALDRISERAFWVRTVADLAAYAVALSRAFGTTIDRQRRLEAQNDRLRTAIRDEPEDRLIGASPAWQTVLQQVDLVAPTDATVLISGETGTGKELIARQIHRRSTRRDRPLVKVNCAAIPAELFESEFFGHRKGAFSGADRDRPGRFQAADKGTLFLDEVGEIPLELQAKLLRAVQEGRFEPVGGDATRQVDVRIIAATNRDLKAMIARGEFREDLFYRLNLFPIHPAPLRERVQDIKPLVRHFLQLAGERFETGPLRLAGDQVRLLEKRPWPGNVRELQNAVERAVILNRNGVVGFEEPGPGGPLPAPADLSGSDPVPAGEVLTETDFREMMKTNLARALEKCDGRIYGPRGAAALMGLKPTTFASRLKKLGLSREPQQS